MPKDSLCRSAIRSFRDRFRSVQLSFNKKSTDFLFSIKDIDQSYHRQHFTHLTFTHSLAFISLFKTKNTKSKRTFFFTGRNRNSCKSFEKLKPKKKNGRWKKENKTNCAFLWQDAMYWDTVREKFINHFPMCNIL